MGSSIDAEYVVALCHMKDGGPEPYESTRIIATDRADALRKAEEWAVIATATGIVERTWLQVTLDGVGVLSRELGKPFG